MSSFLNSIIEPFIFQSNQLQKPLIVNIQKTEQLLIYDKDVIEKIVSNLISNALKYGEINESINFESKIEEHKLQLFISNVTNQITPQNISKLFDRFYQTNINNPGVGIGLALVKELVQLYEGQVETKLENQLLTFKVTLPLHQNLKNSFIILDNVNPTHEDKKIEVSNNELPILLIVDDNPEILTILNSIFEKDFKVLTCKNGKKALDIAQKEIPDCIISDIMMPDMNGFEFSKHIKHHELTSFIPVILLTAKNSDSVHLEALQSTADAYLTKPFNHEILKPPLFNKYKSAKNYKHITVRN